MTLLARRIAISLLALLTAASLGFAQSGALAQAQDQQAAYSQAELDRMLAPVALYPDPLLSQILMAATYPLDVVEAARWSRANPRLKGDDAVRAVQDRDWDPSVKSLAAFPNVLQRMNENLEWTRQLGDAFLAQEPHVMETVQQLRQKARAAGNLQSNERMRVADEGGTIVIEPVSPRVVYVPYYDPWVVYGPWWWPHYAPVFWAPWPGYVIVHRHYPWRPAPAVVGVAWGPSVGVSVGFFFGGVDWRQRHVRVVQVNNYYVNRTVVVNRGAAASSPTVQRTSLAPGRWQHDPARRRGVPYRDPAVQQRFAASAQTRDALMEQKAQPRSQPQAQDRRTEQRRPENAAPAAPARPQARPDAKRERADRPERKDVRREERRRDAERPEPRGDARRQVIQNSRPAVATPQPAARQPQPQAPVAQPQPQPRPQTAQPQAQPRPPAAQPQPRREANGNGDRPQRAEKEGPRREARQRPPRQNGRDDRS